MKRWLIAFALPATVLLSQLTVALYILAFSHFFSDEVTTCFAILLPGPTVYLTFVALRARSIEAGTSGVPWARLGCVAALALVAVLLVRAKSDNGTLSRPQTFRELFGLLHVATAAYLGFTIAVPFVSSRRSVAQKRAGEPSVPPLECDQLSLTDFLTNAFNREECWMLLRSLDVNPESIKGSSDGTQPLFASEIVDYFRRRGTMPALCEALRAARNRSA
jgi:hypothetical protein